MHAQLTVRLVPGAAALVLALCSVDAYPRFVSRIPNANAIAGVQSIGHRNIEGGGALNVFGEAFQAQNSQWTLALCHADSDGDGATNGEELGDPCCKWSASSSTTQMMRTGSQVSHPGVANTWTPQQLQAMVCKEAVLGSGATGAEDAAAASGGVTTTAPAATPSSLPRSDRTAHGAAAANGRRAGSDGDDAPSTIDPVGLMEIPPSLVPESPATAAPKTKTIPAPAPLPLPASTTSGASGQRMITGAGTFPVAVMAGAMVLLATTSTTL